jgi:hypothetical protein
MESFMEAEDRKLMEKSWVGLFREHILCELPVSKVSPFFNDTFGRPAKEIYAALGVLLLQQIYDLTDEKTVSQLAFDVQWHYVLDIVTESDEAKYLCAKTLWNMRDLVIENHLDAVLFDCTTEVLAKVFNADTSAPRIDSVQNPSDPDAIYTGIRAMAIKCRGWRRTARMRMSKKEIRPST